MELDLDAIGALLEKKNRPRNTDHDIDRTCNGCGVPIDPNGYCTNAECPVDAPVPTYPCAYCGHCPTPGNCVWSYACPTCGAGQAELCKEGARVVAPHEARRQ